MYRLGRQFFEKFSDAAYKWLEMYGEQGGCVGIECNLQCIVAKTRQEWKDRALIMIEGPLCPMGMCSGAFLERHTAVVKALLEDIKDIGTEF